MALPTNPTVVPIVTYQYLFCLPSSERLQPPAQRKAQVLLSGFVPRVPRAADYG
jgi:hypothetical protein